MRLSTKILLLALLNLSLLAGLGFVVLALQGRGGWGQILLATASERISSLGRLVALEFGDAPAGQRERVLARYGEQYGVKVVLFDNDTGQIGGEPVTLPTEVERRLREGPPRGHPLGERPPPGGLGKKGMGPGVVFYEYAGEPRRYWVGVRTPIRNDAGGPPLRGTVFLVTPNLLGNSLFVDVRPLLGAAAAVLVISALCWWPFLRGLTREIRNLTAATGAMAEGSFGVSAASKRKDELGELAGSVRVLGGRLQEFVVGQKRFLGDIAHELSAPIARTQWALGILERDVDEKQRESLADLVEEVEHMARLVNELLLFSKAGLQPEMRPLREVEVGPVVRRAARREAGERVELQLTEGLRAMADEEYLDRSVGNLVRNAVRYAGAGRISVTASLEGGNVLLAVEDEGPGLPAGELVKVFSPFYRLDQARTRSSGGTGLGLAIVKSCVEACGGSVGARNRMPRGLRVEIHLRPA
jgi:two-component system, OmpR family, sensor histidine kinase CpxA